MKKKTIEKIPYLGLKKISRIKSVKYIGVTAVKNIGHQRHLFLEVYENKKESKKIPVVRITLTKKDFGTYWPDKHVWTRQQVSYYRPIWMETHTGGILTDENILQSPEDLERIKNFCGTKLFDASWWWEHISRYEADITSTERINRVERERKRRQEALKDRQANTKALPEKAILYRADHAYFHDEHFLYYKKHGSRADIACSKCGGVTTARWKSSGAYEDQFERNIEEPRENSFGTCPMCGARGQYKCKGKVKGSIRKTRYLFLGQKYKDNGFVMRYIQVEKEWTLGFVAGENGNEMYDAYEKLSGVELARAYFEPGKKVQVDYNKHDPYLSMREDRGYDFEVVPGPVIDVNSIVDWCMEGCAEYDVKKIAMDTYRYTLFKMAFEERGLTIEDRKNPNGVVRLIRKITSATGIIAPFIQSMFSQGMINFGASAIMRWYTNNTSVSEDKFGNKMFGKIEPKLRKNDGFMAFDVAMFCKDELEVQIIYI